MGLFGRLKKVARSLVPERRVYRGPSEKYADAITAMAAGIGENLKSLGGSGWVSIIAREPGSKHAVLVQVAGREINLPEQEHGKLSRDPPVGDLLAAEGLSALADSAVRKDVGLFELPGASAEELAAAMDVLLRRHFQLSERYEVEAELE